MKLGDILVAQNKKVQKTIAIAALPLLCALIWALLVWPFLYSFTSQREWREVAKHSLARDRAIATSESLIREQLNALPASQLITKFYQSAAKDSGANAFQIDIRNLFGAVGALAQTVTPNEMSHEGRLSILRLHVTSSMTIDQLKNLLAHLESHPRYIRVERLDITSPSVQPRDQNPLLTVAVEFAAFELSQSAELPRMDSQSAPIGK